MKLLLLCASILNSIVLHQCIYENRLGHCEPLTVEFLAGLVSEKARQLFVADALSRRRELRYDLYTRRNPTERQVLHLGEFAALRASHFNTTWPVRFSFHGWNGQTSTCSNAAIKDSYLARGDYNVVLVDWSDYALDINYMRVVAGIKEIAQQFNAFARFLHNSTGAAYKDMYLIAHSAGCHVAGMAGKLLKPDAYGVIFALDASGPIHSLLPRHLRLSPADALYVESIQTDVALLGFPSASLAHASFFPNWGLGQPHCPNVTTMEPGFTCDHFSALYYFVESLLDGKAFGAIQCSNYESVRSQRCGCGRKNCEAQAYMGGDPAMPKRGIFYLSTRRTRPFGFGEVCRMRRAIASTVMRLK